MYLVLLVLPPLAFAAFASLGPARTAWSAWSARRAVVAGSAACVLCAIVTGAMIAGNHRWGGATEVAWTGVSVVRPGTPLRIGGTRQMETIGWPTGTFTPDLEIWNDTSSGNRFAIRIARQTGFLSVGHRVLNGEPLPEGGAVTSDGFRIAWSRRHGVQLQLTVSDSNGQVIASSPMPSKAYDATIPMSVLTYESLVSLRSHHRGDVAARLETWAATHWLLSRASESLPTKVRRFLGMHVAPLGEQAEPRLVGEADTITVFVDQPDTLSMLWPGRSQRFHLDADDGRVTLTWFAPWVRNSPTPPESHARKVAFVVCGMPLPGDTAFTIPFGGALNATRAHLTIYQGQFGAPADASPLPDDADSASRFRGQRSDTAITAGPYRVRVTTLSDIPAATRFALILAAGVAMIIAALAIYVPRLPMGQAWLVTGVTLTYWTLLLLRFSLAVRFALDPSHLDHLSVSGVEMAALTLTVMPGILLLSVVALRHDGDGATDARLGQYVLWHAVALFVVGALIDVFARHLWPNLPPRFLFPWSRLVLAIVVVGLIAVVLSATSRVNSRNSRWLRVASGALPSGLRVLERLVPVAGEQVWKSTFVNREPGRYVDPDVRKRTKTFRVTWIVLVVTLGFVMVLLGALRWALQQAHVGAGTELQEVVEPLLFFWAPAGLLLAAPARGTAKEKAHLDRGERLSLVRTFLVIGVIVTSTLLLPVAVHSAGELLAAGAVLLSATVVLLATSRFGVPSLVCLGFLSALGVGIVFVFLNVNPLTPTRGAWGEMRPRVLAWLQGPGLASRLPLLPLNDSSNVVGEQKISNAIEHVWENEALAQEGRYWGLGWGNAPTDRSLIRHDTSQYDSAFSFYIASEFGFWGGFALLLVYLTPLVLVLSHTSRATLGSAFAAAIASAVFIEAAAHALMNYGAMPFTGRDLPMLAVNSGTDLWRWTVLLFLLMQAAVYWRTNGAPASSPSAIGRRSLVIALVPLMTLAWFGWRGWKVAERKVAPMVFDWTPMMGYIEQLVHEGRLTYDPQRSRIVFKPIRGYTSGATLIALEVDRFNTLSDSEKANQLLAHHAPQYAAQVSRVQTVGDWDAVMDSLRLRDERQRTVLRPSIFRLVRRRPEPDTADAGETEAAAVDPAPQSLASDTTSPDLGVPTLKEPLEVDTNPEFNTRVTFRASPKPDEMPRLTWTGASTTTWTIGSDAFAVLFSSDKVTTSRVEDETDRVLWMLDDSSGSFVLSARMVNPATRRLRTVRIGTMTVGKDSVQFVPGDITGRKLGGFLPWSRRFERGEPVALSPGDSIRVAPVSVSSRSFDLVLHRTQPSALVGPAWVRGEWINAYEPDRSIPWIEYVAHVLPREYDRLGDSAAAQYASLTLDETLQRAAQVFVDTMGRKLHDRLLRADDQRKRSAIYRLPPRVALSIIRLPDGEALALGGWPRMSSEPYWFRDATTGEWVPPVSFIDARAPASIRVRYGTDRNFEPLVMGSATKPLWASVVLGLHPGLERQLAVTGAHTTEDSAFGIRLSDRGWEVEASASLNGGAWCDLTSFLARSDNRYQVRLGLLGLAESDGGDSSIAVEDAESPSRVESMDGGADVWHRYPRFPVSIAFSYDQPQARMTLGDAPLVERWRSAFGIETRYSRTPLYRRSFWTGDEADDQRVIDPRLPAQLDVISPQRANFAFDSVRSARAYVNLLLGGGTNAWANVDFSAAFASAITGRIVLAHITPEPVSLEPYRVPGAREAALIRPGTMAVVASPGGTAYEAFRRALPVMRQFGDVYAKTGTLAGRHGVEPMSRIVLAVVRWSADRRQVKDGMVFSLAVERGGSGTAPQWLADFVLQNESIIRRIFATPPASQRSRRGQSSGGRRRSQAAPTQRPNAPAPASPPIAPPTVDSASGAAPGQTAPVGHRVEPQDSPLLRRIGIDLDYAQKAASLGQYRQADIRLRQAYAWVDSLRATGQDDGAADSLATIIIDQRLALRDHCLAISRQSGVPSPPCP